MTFYKTIVIHSSQKISKCMGQLNEENFNNLLNFYSLIFVYSSIHLYGMYKYMPYMYMCKRKTSFKNAFTLKP